MKTKTLIISVFLSGTILFFPDGDTFAAERTLWLNKCASCHDGKTAPPAESLVEKYKTIEDFTKAVQTKGHKGMNILKSSLPLLKKIAQELGIKELQEK
ncbi:MAG: hypothetical protein HZB54_07515 [Deltaproteobacteria bacterium]|nr:hypothetical protein [Deltaproteobacteria bacterium]